MRYHKGTEGRAVISDTETTGFDPDTGDRILEIGMVEIRNMVPTGRTLHFIINPDRDIPEEVVKVHGIDNEAVKGKPFFHEVAQEIADFIGNDPIIFHNAPFDMKFYNFEMEMAGMPRAKLRPDQVIDSLAVFKRDNPNAPGTLDALCRRYGIDNSNRTLHGALLDSRILADVWMAMNGGPQMTLDMAQERHTRPVLVYSSDGPITLGPSAEASRRINHVKPCFSARQRPAPLAVLSDDEIATHEAWMQKSKIAPDLWNGVLSVSEPDSGMSPGEP